MKKAPYFMTNKDWFRNNQEWTDPGCGVPSLILTDKATDKAKESYKQYCAAEPEE